MCGAEQRKSRKRIASQHVKNNLYLNDSVVFGFIAAGFFPRVCVCVCACVCVTFDWLPRVVISRRFAAVMYAFSLATLHAVSMTAGSNPSRRCRRTVAKQRTTRCLVTNSRAHYTAVAYSTMHGVSTSTVYLSAADADGPPQRCITPSRPYRAAHRSWTLNVMNLNSTGPFSA